MDWQFTTTSFTSLLIAALTLGAALLNWRQRSQRGVRYLALAMFFMSIWAFANTLELAAIGVSAKVFWVSLESLAGGTFINLLLLFVLEYRGLTQKLNRFWVWCLWIPTFALVILELTNPRHHLVWTGFLPGPTGSNLLFYHHGPAFFVSIGYGIFLILLMLGTLIREAVRSKGRERFLASWLSISMSIPFITTLIYTIWSNNSFGANIVMIGFAVCGLLISWFVFDNLLFQVAGQTRELQEVFGALKAETESHLALEASFQETQDMLAQRLSDQSQKLSGFYDLILIGSRSLEIPELLARSLEKICSMLDCEAACFYQPAQRSLHLEAHHGLTAQTAVRLRSLPFGWLSDERDVHADVDTSISPLLPEKFALAGFGAAMHKHVYVQDRQLGTISILWRDKRRFSVDEIVLFGTLTDQMGIILEYVRLRHQIATAAMLQERRRLARDLHDSVTQSLHSLVLSSETASQLLHTQPERVDEALAHLGTSARQALKEMRLLLYELRLVPLEEIPFTEAIKNRLEAVERRASMEVKFQVDVNAAWPKTWEVELYPFAMEALNNALKHSGATQVEVRLSGNEDDFEMHIRDNGHGFDPQAVPGGGMGLYNMAERAGRLKGRMEIHSAPGKGTEISLLVQSKKEPGPS